MKDEIPEKPKEEKQPAEKAVPQKNCRRKRMNFSRNCSG
jgi:hypothetical protein